MGLRVFEPRAEGSKFGDDQVLILPQAMFALNPKQFRASVVAGI